MSRIIVFRDRQNRLRPVTGEAGAIREFGSMEDVFVFAAPKITANTWYGETEVLEVDIPVVAPVSEEAAGD